MNHYCGIQQSVFSAREEIRGSVPDRRDPVVCPKPRRLHPFNDQHHPVRSLRWQLSHQSELCDSKAGTDLLDIILTKGGCGGGGGVDGLENSSSCAALPVASSPPFFCGSPPSRVSNPLIQDARFGDEKLSPLSPMMMMMVPPPSGSSSSSPTSSTSSSAAARKAGGCVGRANFGNKPAVRVEGFDCLDRDRRNCSIPALA